MTQKEDVKEKEVEPALVHRRQTDIDSLKAKNLKAKRGKKLIKGKEMPWEINEQGVIRRYTFGQELTNDNWTIFCHEVRHHSGKHRHQGGKALFVIKGKGYSVVDGVRFDWQEGDLICLPVKKGGCVHQHFNVDGKPSRWVAMHTSPIFDLLGNAKEQLENFSMWKKELVKEPR